MGFADKILPHYTYDDWIHWEGRWELLDGHPIAMSPMPLPVHQRVASELVTEFTNALRKSKCRKCKVYQPLDYKIAEDIILVPDLLIVCDEIKKSFLDFPPKLVIEILSPSTALRDRNTKFEIYRQQKITYYLIVDTEKKLTEVYQLAENNYLLQQIQNDAFTFELEDDCSINVSFQNIWE